MEGKDLRKAGLKVTLPRLKIIEILEHTTTRHMSAEDIYKTLLESNEDIGLATVYRVPRSSRPPDSSRDTISRMEWRFLSSTRAAP